MKRIELLLFVSWLWIGASFAQELIVKQMEALPPTADLSASTFERKDLNNKPCALVKVQLATMGAQFEGNVVGDVAYKTGEYWVYMTEGSYMLNIKHPSFVPLSVNFHDYGIDGVKGKVTYRLTLLMPLVGSMNIDDGMRYLLMTVEPATATVYVDNNLQTLQNGTLSLLLPMGQHQYRVEAQAYDTKSGTFTIGDGKLELPIKLESNMATLSISCATQGTQIYVNDQLRGTSSWSGTLPAGTYRIEGRLEGHHHHRQSIQLSQRDNKHISIPALQAMVGNLNVNYQPANAEVWLDGKKLGTSPDVFRNIIIGTHAIELRKEGYTSKQERVTIEEGQTAILSGALDRQQATQSQATTSSSSGSQVETFTVKGVSFNMVRVDGGTFMMGATSEQKNSWEASAPVHQVTLSPYYIGETEVNQMLWEAVMGKNPSKFKGENRPVERVSWDDCQDFILKLNQITGKRFRLPTEAEWEFAARGGNKSKHYKYSGSNTIDDVAWYDKDRSKTHEVATKKPNELNIFDMSGNVNEWCQDWNGRYSSEAQINPTGPSNGNERVSRGGSWASSEKWCRVEERLDPRLIHDPKDTTFPTTGLRLAL